MAAFFMCINLAGFIFASMNDCLFNAGDLTKWVASVFMAKGFSESHAHQAAEVLVAADLRGIDSHGVARLIGYLRLIDKGRLNPRPNLKITRETPSTANIDADSGVGLISAPYAMKIAIEKAKSCGSGWVAIHNSNHFGIAGYHAMMALEHDMIGFALTNASPLVTPANGLERMLGTNPICIAIPAMEEPPFILDMATSAASNGKLEIAERKNKPIPHGWVLQEDGSQSQNPADLKNNGYMIPLGSDTEHSDYKGYGLSAAVDILSGVLSGANYGPWVPPFVAFLEPLSNLPGKGIGHFVGAWRIDAFREAAEFKKDMDLWIKRFRETKKRNPDIPVLIPGDPERMHQKSRSKEGIPVIQPVLNNLMSISSELNLPLPQNLI